MKKSPVGSWRSFFNLGKSSSVSKRKLQRNESEPSEMKAMALKGECSCLPFPSLCAQERPAWGLHLPSCHTALLLPGHTLSTLLSQAPTGCVLLVLFRANCLLPMLYPQIHSIYKCIEVPSFFELYRLYIGSVCLKIHNMLVI